MTEEDIKNQLQDEFEETTAKTAKSRYKRSKEKVFKSLDDQDEMGAVPEEAYERKLNLLKEMWVLLNKPYATPEEMAQLLVIKGSRGETFIWDERSKKYEYWDSRDELYSAIKSFAPSFHEGTRWVSKSNQFILHNFCFRAKKIDFHMLSYDSKICTESLTADISALHKTFFKPKYHADVHSWLMAFGGKNSDRLLDWLASFPRLDRPTCMLYICGSPGIGKNLLAESLVGLWGGFADWEDRASDYQSDMGRVPFLWANEDMERPRRTSIMASIRRVIGSGNQRINEKQRPAYGMRAYYRLLVTANNPTLLKSWANLSSDDISAIRERVGYLYASIDGKHQLQALADDRNIDLRDLTDEFVKYKVVEHVLWLSENRNLDAGGRRLWVEGWENDIINSLEFETNEAFLFAQVFHRSKDMTLDWLRDENGEYWMNYSKLVSEWDEVSPTKKADRIRWSEMQKFTQLLYTGEKVRKRPVTGGRTSSALHYYKLCAARLQSLLVKYGYEEEAEEQTQEVPQEVVVFKEDKTSVQNETTSKEAHTHDKVSYSFESEKTEKTQVETVRSLMTSLSDSVDLSSAKSHEEFKQLLLKLAANMDMLSAPAIGKKK